MKRLTKLIAYLLACTLFCSAETIFNQDCGFEVDLPDHWLYRDLGPGGLLLNSEEVRQQVEPYTGITLNNQIQRLHELTKQDGYQFKDEHSYMLNGYSAHEMVFFRKGKYKIYYVVGSGEDYGFLWTVQSDSTDSEAFLEGQSVIDSFRVLGPK